MNVMLINPPPEHYIEEYDSPDYPHIGVAYLAGALEQQGLIGGKDLHVVDAKLSRLRVRQTLDLVRQHKPRVVGLTAYTFDILYAGHLAKLIKETDPTITILVGGVHSSALPVETLKRIRSFDIAMVGECEGTFFRVLQNLEAGKKEFRGIGGVAWWEDEDVVYENALFRDRVLQTPVITRYDDINKLPFPAYHLMPQARTYQIMSARGCPRACSFCVSPYGRKSIRELTPERVIAEMEWVIGNFKPETYKFNDETFGFNAERMHLILDEMNKRGLGRKTRLFASMRADRMSPEILKKMKAANFYCIEVGVETGDPDVLKRIRKGETMEETERAVGWVKEAGMNVYCGFIIGHPGETRESAQATVRFAAKLNPTRAAFGLMVPYPGTEVAEWARKGMYGYRLLSDDWADYNKQFGNALELETLSRAEMERIQALGYLHVYLANRRYWDCAKFMATYYKAGLGFVKRQFQPKESRTRSKGAAKPSTMDAGEDFRYLNFRS
jgi:anaerobic magnesium-protoporphyrin IX monomethyl ester cyclase